MPPFLLPPFDALLLTFGVTVAVAWLIVRTRDAHLHLTGDHPESGPQKLHTEATPRIGGVAVMAGLLAGLGWLYLDADAALRTQINGLSPGWLLASLVPLFALGLLEDVCQSVSVRLRLGLSLAAGAAASVFAGVRIEALGLPFIDTLLRAMPLLGLVLTAVAVAGLVHAMNIVDGLNGLLAGIAIGVLGALAVVSAQFGETALQQLALAGIAAVAGFGVFNFPRARLFCGDAGAYLIGFLCAVIVIVLVRRQPAISPWFALAVLMHPVTETLYSVWRRARNGLKATEPDARHMHSLWSARLAEQAARAGGKSGWLAANPGGALRTAAMASLPPLLAAGAPTNALQLQCICLGYVALFIVTVRLLERPVAAGAAASLPSSSDSR